MTLLESLRERGFTIALSPDGQRILISPAPRLTPEDRQAIKGNREAMLVALDQEQPWSNEVPDWNADEPLRLQAVARVSLDGLEPVVMPLGQWLAFQATIKAHNETARNAWLKKQHEVPAGE